MLHDTCLVRKRDFSGACIKLGRPQKDSTPMEVRSREDGPHPKILTFQFTKQTKLKE